MRYFLLLTIVIASPLILFASTQSSNTFTPQKELNSLEKNFSGKIGVYAIDTNNNQVISHRGDERFPIQSTLKLISAAALLKQSDTDKNLLHEKIIYTEKDLIPWHPITGKYISTGMTLEALAEAAVTYSDNPAVNLIIRKLGGPKAITAFAGSIGNKSFNVEHYDGYMNSAPNSNQDTATPKDMALSLQKLTLSPDVLTAGQQAMLVTWMQNNTTGYRRIRAGTPNGWTVADKTGSGDYGIANDIGLLWSPYCKPIVLAIYTQQDKQDATVREDIVAMTTHVVLTEFAKKDACFQKMS